MTIFHELRELRVQWSFPSKCGLTVGDWLAFAHAWPRMESIYIGGPPLRSQQRPLSESFSTSCAAFVHLVRFCPDLEAIGINIQDEHIPELKVPLPVCSNDMELHLCCSFLTHRESTAALIAVVFPYVKSVTQHDHDYSQDYVRDEPCYDEEWEEMSSLVLAQLKVDSQNPALVGDGSSVD